MDVACGSLHCVACTDTGMTRIKIIQIMETSNTLTLFLCPCDDSQGALRFAPVCPSVCLSVRPSVCPSVRHALRYRVCVINSSHSFKWIFLKPCIPIVDILKMCMWVFGGIRMKFDRITAFPT